MPRVLTYHRLGNRLLAGPMPFHEDHVAALHAEGVTAVVNLCELREYWQGERELLQTAYQSRGVTEHHLPVRDGATIPPEVFDRALEIARRSVTYVHCRGGRERSAAVAGAVLAGLEGLSADDAIRHATARRPVFAPLAWQVEGLRTWAAKLSPPPSAGSATMPPR